MSVPEAVALACVREDGAHLDGDIQDGEKSVVGFFVCRLVGWLVGPLVGWSVGRSVSPSVGHSVLWAY